MMQWGYVISQLCKPGSHLWSHHSLHVGSRRQLPEAECRSNDCTVMAVTTKGGHCAHLQGLNPFGPSYLDNKVVLFFKAVLGFKHSMKEE